VKKHKVIDMTTKNKVKNNKIQKNQKEHWLKQLFHFFNRKKEVVEHIKPIMVPIHEERKISSPKGKKILKKTNNKAQNLLSVSHKRMVLSKNKKSTVKKVKKEDKIESYESQINRHAKKTQLDEEKRSYLDRIFSGMKEKQKEVPKSSKTLATTQFGKAKKMQKEKPAETEENEAVQTIKSTKTTKKVKEKSLKKIVAPKQEVLLKKEKVKSITKLQVPEKETTSEQKRVVEEKPALERIIVPSQPTTFYSTQEDSPSSNEGENLSALEEEALKAKKIQEETEDPKVKAEQEKKIKELASKITASRKLTDFDRILLAVNSHGTIKASELKKELKMNNKQFNECVKILHKNGDIQIEYPLFGSMKLTKVKKKIDEDVF
jgi:hypothetical protein